MAYDNMDGTPMYQVEKDENWYYAKDPALLDEFLTKLDAADTDEKKLHCSKSMLILKTQNSQNV